MEKDKPDKKNSIPEFNKNFKWKWAVNCFQSILNFLILIFLDEVCISQPVSQSLSVCVSHFTFWRIFFLFQKKPMVNPCPCIITSIWYIPLLKFNWFICAFQDPFIVFGKKIDWCLNRYFEIFAVYRGEIIFSVLKKNIFLIKWKNFILKTFF